MDAIPQAVIEIPLPIPVQTAKASYQFIGVKTPDGSAFGIADLTAYQNSYSVTKSDMKVTFVEIKIFFCLIQIVIIYILNYKSCTRIFFILFFLLSCVLTALYRSFSSRRS